MNTMPSIVDDDEGEEVAQIYVEQGDLMRFVVFDLEYRIDKTQVEAVLDHFSEQQDDESYLTAVLEEITMILVKVCKGNPYKMSLIAIAILGSLVRPKRISRVVTGNVRSIAESIGLTGSLRRRN
jgi:hypothetical protein